MNDADDGVDNDDIPSATTRKFYPDGRPRPCAGNTIISRVPLHTPVSAALTSVCESLADQQFSDCFSLLPDASFHMTVLEGVTEHNRHADVWPADLPVDADLEECHRHFRQALTDGALACPPIVRMRPVRFTAGHFPGAALLLSPADAAHADKLHQLRHALSARLRIPPPQPDRYRFHISLGYLIRPMSDAERTAYAALRARWSAQFRASFPIIELGRPEFCTFDDMAAFHHCLSLGHGRSGAVTSGGAFKDNYAGMD